MNVLVAGLSARDEAAFGFFLGRSMKGWSWASTPAARGTVLPKADLLVADLVALGLAQWSVAAEAQLLKVLDGNRAVLLLPANDQTWNRMDPAISRQHALVWLQKPYGTEDMRQALEKAAAAQPGHGAHDSAQSQSARRRSEPSSNVPVPTADARPASQAVPAMVHRGVLPTVSFRSHDTADTVKPETGDDVPGLTITQLHARLALLPDPARHAFLRKLSAMLERGRPFEARFTVHNSLIFHPADGWVASNTPMSVIERVCQSDALAAAVTLRDIEGGQADERAHRLGMNLRELDTFLWNLASATLDGTRMGATPATRP